MTEREHLIVQALAALRDNNEALDRWAQKTDARLAALEERQESSAVATKALPQAPAKPRIRIHAAWLPEAFYSTGERVHHKGSWWRTLVPVTGVAPDAPEAEGKWERLV